MGILELHFHESEFKFAPSMTNKGEDLPMTDEDSSAERGVDKIESGEPVPSSSGKRSAASSSGSSAKKGLAVIAGLAFLIGAGAVAKKLIGRKLSSDEADERLSTEKVEESIEIAD